MKQTIITNSYEETQKLGADFARKFNSIPVLALHGDLGGGKTTFIQGLAKGLGIEKKIISPTFIIMRSYEIHKNLLRVKHLKGGRLKRSGSHDSFKVEEQKFFYHVDLYRIKDEKDIGDLGLIELMQDPRSLFAIEWPEKIKSLLPRKRLDIFFEYLDENKRKITF